MKIVLLTITALMISIGAKAQVQHPVKWAYASKKISATEVMVLLKATIDKGWHIYSQNPDGGGLKTTFTFKPSKEYILMGKTLEPKPIVKYEPAIKANVIYFENLVVFQQKVKLKSANKKTINGKLEYMACKTQCLPPEEITFNIPIGK
ncbi:sugar transporter [Mucilaginibacter terrigena]|uniref:Sugar transporter n=1 Tax=Mucilaginibacter terrigena TaxID=2492395 RepID=A0A4Q5LKM9_9SPHI|nr:protein-disulfide reductase DsbD N-terminal domain-containing protein [Mucilaginibacter terrigena]RYU89380.1 sugar transporter [Mucilaginibacter terrigena]